MKIKDIPDETIAKIKKFNCMKYRVNRCFKCPMQNEKIRCTLVAIHHYQEISNADVDIAKLQAEGLI